MSIERRFKMALDETRLLIIGAQILFGFQFEAVFQEAFERLPKTSRWLNAAALLLMAATLACLVAPASEHRLFERGQITGRIRRVTTTFAGIALLPFGIALGLDLYVVIEHVFSNVLGILAGAFFAGIALLSWYAGEFGYRRFVLGRGFAMNEKNPRGSTPLETKIEQMLTEARIAIPGAQALLGFQLVVALNHAFESLPQSSKIVHAIALGCIALAMILLIAPAAFHRLAFHGEDDERFFRLGSNLVSAALLPIALGISGDIYVALSRIAGEGSVAAAAAAAALMLFLGLWYVRPLLLRAHAGRQRS